MEYIRDAPVGLRWTGHPLMDMGVAGLTVFAQKRRPEEVIGADLEAFAAWAEGAYQTKEGTAWVAVAFTLNGFLNVSFTPEKKRESASAVLNSFRQPNTLETKCTFFDLPANQMAARDLVPMLTGREPSNFFPDGEVGLPLSGLALTTLQALSSVAPLVGGRLMILETDDPKLLIALCRKWQPMIQQRVQLSQTTGEKAGGWSAPRSRLITELIAFEKARDQAQDPDLEYNGSATIYHASNSGQGPDIAIYTLELPALRFVRMAQNVRYREAWNYLTSLCWREADKDKDPEYAKRNDVFEAVFGLPFEAPEFFRRFFYKPTRNKLRRAEEKKPKRGKSEPAPPQAVPVPLWGLLELFLQEVVGMEKTRIQQIRTLGDTLAEAVQQENDKRLFQRIYQTKKPSDVRQLLITFGMRRLKTGLEPIRLDNYLEVFEEGEELTRSDFYLAWDLTKMRVIETLFDKKWLNPENLEGIEEEEGAE